MNEIVLVAASKFGLEALVKREVQALGFADVQVSNGRIQFPAAVADIPRLNVWLRFADRVQVLVGEFEAVSFDALFEQTKALPWEVWIPANGRFPVTAKTVKSQLQSGRSCQAIVKKAIVERLKSHYHMVEFPETGPVFAVQVALYKNRATLTLDTSGVGLHKRGYRVEAGAAPLKETLAAALVQLSYWQPERILLDPMCGSGTILIEAAMMARNMAPGLKRQFAAEGWPVIPARAWETAREEARAAERPFPHPQLYGYDNDPAIIEIARQNAIRAGVAADIQFAVKPLDALWIDRQYGVMITNPPYGIRLADKQAVNQLYIILNKIFRKKKGWSVYVLTADRQFPKYFKRGRPDRVRKLYNGTIQVNYYQYFGQKPPRG
ncbi:MAG: class I SAM-dependent RNA methyltransferase [Chloroflexi bacterium]|nr:MAG: class I SAM-dependent RNA methyltransferase [Chloroflexota bacterium]